MANEQESAAPQSDGSSENIEELVARCLLRVEADGQDGLSEFLSQHPDAASQIKKRIAWLADMGLVTLPADSKIDLSPDHSGVYRTLRESRSAPESVSDGEGFGHYRVVKELGRGGQAIVYLADDTRLNRKVALKVMTGFGDFDDAALARFQREAEVASRLDDPGICTVYESGAFDKTAYIAMRLVDGETLGERIKRARDDDRDEPASLFFDLDDATEEAPSDSETNTVPDRIDVMRTIEVVERTARALHTAHEAGVIHRDIKPGNIMVTREGDPVVLDFGLAGDTESDLQTLTREGDFFGTPAYMSPEQLAANRITVDRRTDVYSLGVLLYECLTLDRPFQVPTREALYQAILTEEPSSPRSINPAISPDLEVVIATAMDKNRDRRYQTAEDLAEELRRVREHEPIQARPASTVTRVLRWTQRNPARATATVATVLVLLISAALITWSLGESERAGLSDAKADAERRSRELATQRAEEAETEREALSAAERERVFRRRLLELSTGERNPVGLVGGDMKAGARASVSPYFDAFDAFRLPLMSDEGVDAVVAALERVGGDDPSLQSQMRRALYDAALVLAQGDVAMAVAVRDGRVPPRLTAERRAELEDVLQSSPESVAHWERLAGILVADTSAWRRAVWAEIIGAKETGSSPDLGELTSDAYLKDQTASSLVWLAGTLLSGADVVRIVDHIHRVERIIDLALEKQSSDSATLYTAWITKGVVRYVVAIGLGGSVSPQGREAGLEAALRAFNVSRALRPEAHTTYQWIARGSAALGRSEVARAAFERALSVAPEWATETRVLYGDGLYHGGDLEGALEVFRDLVDENPESGMFHRIVGDALLGLGSVEEAAVSYRKALRLNPNLVNAYVMLSNAQLRLGEPEASFDVLSRAIDLVPGQRQIRNMMAFTLDRLGDLDRAETVFQKLRKATPTSADPFLLKGQVLAMSGDQERALEVFEQGLEVDPRSNESWLAVAMGQNRLDRHGEARKTCREGLAIWPDDVQLHALLAICLWHDAESEEAVVVSRAAMALGADGGGVNLALGGGLSAIGSFAEAVPYLEEAAELAATDRQRSWSLSGLVTALLATQDMAGARGAAERLLKAKPKSAWARWHLSTIDAFQGDYAAALARLRELRDVSSEGSGQRASMEDILAIQPVVSGVAEARTASDLLRASVAAGHRWEMQRCVELFDEAYKRAKSDASITIEHVLLGKYAAFAARAAAMMGRGLGREYVPPLPLRDESGAPLRDAAGHVRFIDSRPARMLSELMDEGARVAANERAYGLLQICLDEILAGLSRTDDKDEVKRLRGGLKKILDDPFLVIFRYPPKDAPWAARAKALMDRVAEQWLRER